MNLLEFRRKFQKVPVVEFPNTTAENPKVSIVVQTFNHASYIAQCLDGILKQQTNFEYELLLGEDDSKDGTREICLEYAKKYPHKIKLFLHSRENNIVLNGSPSGRFNFLHNMYQAKGKYIAMCEGDDYWTDSLKLQKQIDLLESDDSIIASIHNAEVANSITNETYLHHADWGDFRVVSEKEVIELGGYVFPTASLMFRNISQLEVKYPVAGDIQIIFELIKQGKIHYIPEPMCVYRRHDKGAYSALIGNKSKFIESEIPVIRYYHLQKSMFGKELEAVFNTVLKRRIRKLVRLKPILGFHVLWSLKDVVLSLIFSKLKRSYA